MGLTVAFLPTFAVPYQSLLAGGLARAGVEVEFIERLPTADWLRANRGRVAVLHLHWLHGLYMARLRTPLQVAAYLSRLRLARALGYRLVWTAHNLLPHKSFPRPLHAALRRHMTATAAAVIVHCAAARDLLQERFPGPAPVHVIPIGPFAGLYPPSGRAAARRALLLPPDAFVWLALGNIAAYKGLDDFVAAFRQTAGRDEVALIAGRNRDARVVERLRAAAAADPRLHLRVGEVPPADMGRYLAAADAAVAPYRDILTSGTAVTALSHGLPVVAPALGCLPELVPPDAGVLYPPGEPGALARALREMRGRDVAAMGAAGRAHMLQYDWDTIGRRTAAVYEATLA